MSCLLMWSSTYPGMVPPDILSTVHPSGTAQCVLCACTYAAYGCLTWLAGLSASTGPASGTCWCSGSSAHANSGQTALVPLYIHPLRHVLPSTRHRPRWTDGLDGGCRLDPLGFACQYFTVLQKTTRQYTGAMHDPSSSQHVSTTAGAVGCAGLQPTSHLIVTPGSPVCDCSAPASELWPGCDAPMCSWVVVRRGVGMSDMASLLWPAMPSVHCISANSGAVCLQGFRMAGCE
jgi:hypothetical protein